MTRAKWVKRPSQQNDSPIRIYRSFEEYDFYQANIASHENFRERLVDHLSNVAIERSEKIISLKLSYKQYHSKWKKAEAKLTQQIDESPKPTVISVPPPPPPVSFSSSSSSPPPT